MGSGKERPNLGGHEHVHLWPLPSSSDGPWFSTSISRARPQGAGARVPSLLQMEQWLLYRAVQVQAHVLNLQWFPQKKRTAPSKRRDRAEHQTLTSTIG